jgi:5-methylcytosine-specific restriction endonuclease McrA
MSLPSPCATPGCANSATTGRAYCTDHAFPKSKRTGARERKVAARMKAEHPYCTYCGAPPTSENPLTIDHVIPLSRGGSNQRENKVVACARCNKAKGDAIGDVRAPSPIGDTIVVIA